MRFVLRCCWVLPLMLLGGRLPVAQAQATLSLCTADLPAAIETVTERPEWARSRWGLLVQTQDGDATLYAREAEAFFLPASATKLLTTAAILHRLGPDFRIRTPVSAIGTAPTLDRLQLDGRGDPSMQRGQLRALAQTLQLQGVEQIRELVVTDRYFQHDPLHPTWELEDVLFYYGTAVNSLILDDNAVALTLYPQALGEPPRLVWGDRLAGQQWQIRNQAVTAASGTPDSIEMSGGLGTSVLNLRGAIAADAEPDKFSMAIPNPARYFLDTLQAELADFGITVAQAQIVPSPALAGELLGHLESPPLADLIRATNQPSNNVHAEALLQTLGVTTGQPEAALTALQTALTELGVESAAYQLRDGSGLSRHNLLSPMAVVQVLQGMARSPHFDTYRASLPVGGVSGTLRQRFQDTPLAGVVIAKTGTMTGVSTLSGYLNPSDYEPLVFSIMVNRSERSVTEQRAAIDEIVLLLGRVQPCEDKAASVPWSMPPHAPASSPKMATVYTQYGMIKRNN
ncbi:MAG: D-alanyl-D-alanine carboxypeptidase/D-alanyl-D-alanine-endopeptidase [Spirulinaceae cyanobacterium SM2_1_0]|nr:D-alanyl-D-alanine carboxypeptidase/D-alanyl-D-alanine-endopeptidase [Spirulinaceae cyanobacterium SM2_1_0]